MALGVQIPALAAAAVPVAAVPPGDTGGGVDAAAFVDMLQLLTGSFDPASTADPEGAVAVDTGRGAAVGAVLAGGATGAVRAGRATEAARPMRADADVAAETAAIAEVTGPVHFALAAEWLQPSQWSVPAVDATASDNGRLTPSADSAETEPAEPDQNTDPLAIAGALPVEMLRPLPPAAAVALTATGTPGGPVDDSADAPIPMTRAGEREIARGDQSRAGVPVPGREPAFPLEGREPAFPLESREPAPDHTLAASATVPKTPLEGITAEAVFTNPGDASAPELAAGPIESEAELPKSGPGLSIPVTPAETQQRRRTQPGDGPGAKTGAAGGDRARRAQVESLAETDRPALDGRTNDVIGDRLALPATKRDHEQADTPPRWQPAFTRALDRQGAEPRHVVAGDSRPLASAAIQGIENPTAEPPVGEIEVVRQIVHSMRVQAAAGGGDAVVRLRPEYLGELTITLKVERGAVTASMHAETPSVRQIIDANEGSLRQALAGHGLQLEKLTILDEAPHAEAGGQERRGHQPREEQRRQPPRPPRTDAGAATFEVVV